MGKETNSQHFSALAELFRAPALADDQDTARHVIGERELRNALAGGMARAAGKKRSRADAARENGKKYGGRKQPWSDDCHWVIELHLVAWEIAGGSKAEFFRRLVWDLDRQCESKGEKPFFEPKNRRKGARSINAKHDRWRAKKKRAAI